MFFEIAVVLNERFFTTPNFMCVFWKNVIFRTNVPFSQDLAEISSNDFFGLIPDSLLHKQTWGFFEILKKKFLEGFKVQHFFFFLHKFKNAPKIEFSKFYKKTPCLSV